jgi:uncharacterized membrane protein YhaH (DUF805 family)
VKELSPIGWALRPLKRYAEFSGRSSRAEFWWFFLALCLIYIVFWFVFFGAVVSSIAAGQSNPNVGMLGAIGAGGILLGLFWLALIVPTIAVQVRRLHDTNRSGWWLGGFYLLYGVYFVLMFGSLASVMTAAAAGGAASPTPPNSTMLTAVMVLGLVMFVYVIALLVFYCLGGTKGPNRFGDDPYGANVEEVFA